MRRPCRMPGALALLACVLAAGPAAASHRLPEYSVKAAFLYHFAEFVQWPDGAPLPATVTIGVLGQDPFGEVLDRAVMNKTVAGRPVAIRRFATIDDLQPCQILFVSGSEGPRLAEVLARLASAPVLTVGEADRFARRGGMIGFFFEDAHVRLEINRAAAEAAGLRISSKLLSVARIVEPQGGRR